MKQGKHAKGNEPNMKKKLFAFIAGVAACCALVASGTLAYFNAEEKAHNVITSGGVEIALSEWADMDKTQPFEDVDGVMPGASVIKVVEVKNTGETSAWIRIGVSKAVDLATGEQGDEALVSMNFNTEHWAQGEDGCWYYNQVLAAGQLTEPLFTAVSFAVDMGNEYQDSKAIVDVTAQAVQSDNNSDSALTATGWPEA